MKAEWGGKSYFSSFSSQARGCAIFFSKDFPGEVIENTVFADPSGNFLLLNFKYESFTISFGCIYGPNEDNPDFYIETVMKETEKLHRQSDFTILLIVIEGMNNLGLVDIFREMHPDSRRYSWRKFGENKRARLDLHIQTSRQVSVQTT